VGKTHPLYQAAVAVPALPAPARAAPVLLTVRQAQTIRDRLPKAEGAAWWALCMTGMIVSELFDRPWRVLRDRVTIGGTKRKARQRVVPLVAPIRLPTCTRRALAAGLTRLTRESYDARRAYTHWMSEAGIPRARRKLYLGHAVGDVTDLYEMGELSRYLREDGAALREYIVRESRQKSQRARVRKQA
jgi:hypothetical protein